MDKKEKKALYVENLKKQNLRSVFISGVPIL